LQDFETVALRKTEVEQREVEAFGRKDAVGCAAVTHPVDGIPGLSQRSAQAFTNHAVVFDEQYAHQADAPDVDSFNFALIGLGLC
jgi:hypothetical protein